MPSLAEFNIGLSFVFDTSAANTAARAMGQTITELKTNVGSLIQQFPQLATSTQQSATAMQGVQQAAATSTQSLTQLDAAVTQNKTQMDSLNQTLTSIGTPLQTLTSTTNEYSGVLNSAGQEVQQFKATSATMENTLQSNNSAIQQAKDSTSQYGNAVSDLEPSLRQLDSGVSDVTGSLNENNTVVKVQSENVTELTGALKQLDPAYQKQIQSNQQATQAQNQTRQSALQLGTQFLALGTLAFGVYNSFVQLEKAHLAVERSQLGVDRAARLVLASEQALDTLIIKNKVNTDAVTEARNNLRLATDALNESIKAGILSGEQFEAQQQAVADALVIMAQRLKEAGVETDSVDLAVQKFGNAIQNNLIKNQQLAIAKTNEFREQIGLMLNVMGVVATATGSVAQILDTFGKTAAVSGALSNVGAAGMRALSGAATALGISVRSLLIGTGVGIGLIALSFLLEALLPKANALSGGFDTMGGAASDATGGVGALDQSLQSTTATAEKAKTGIDLLTQAIETLNNVSKNPAAPTQFGIEELKKVIPTIKPQRPDILSSGVGGTGSFIGPLPQGQGDVSHGILTPENIKGATQALTDHTAAVKQDNTAQQQAVQTGADLLASRIKEGSQYDQLLQELRNGLQAKYQDRIVTLDQAEAYAKITNDFLTGVIPSTAEYNKQVNALFPVIKATSGEMQNMGGISAEASAALDKQLESARNLDLEHKTGQALIENTVRAVFGEVAMRRLAGETAAQYESRLKTLYNVGKTVTDQDEQYVIQLLAVATQLKINKTNAEELNAAELQGKEALTQLITSQGVLLNVLNDTVRTQDLVNKGLIQGRLAAVDFIDSTKQQIAANAQLKNDLTFAAEFYGIKLPVGINLTIDQLKALIEEQLRTGRTTQEMAKIHNEAFAEMHKNIDELISAAVEGGKKWREAWKDVKDFIPKGQRKDFHDFVEDLADIADKNEALFNTASAFHALTDAGIKLSKSDLKDWSSKFKVELRDMKDEMNDIYDKNLVAAVFNPLIDLSKQDLSQTGLELIAAQINKMHEALKDGTTADELAELARQSQILQSVLAKPGEVGSPEAGVGEDFSENVRNLKELGITDGKGGGNGQTVLSQQIEGLKAATKGAAEQIKTDTDTANVAIQSTQTAFANLATEGSNSMSILIANLKPHITTLDTYFNKTVVTAVGNAAKALLAFKIIADSIMGGGSSKGSSNLQKIVFPGGGSSGIPGGNFLGDNTNILPNLPSGNSTGSGGGGGGGNPLGGTNFNQLRTSGGTGSGTQNNPLLNFFITVQKAAAQTNLVVQQEFGKMFTALKTIFLALDKQWSLDMVDMAKFTTIFNTTVQEEIGKMYGALKVIFLAMDKEWSIDLVDMADFAKITSEDIQNEWASMESASEKIFQALTKSWQKEVNTMIRLAADAAHDINAQLATIKDKTVTITCKQSGNCSCGKAEGGMLSSFAEGGMLPMSAADGLQFVTSGRQTYTIGDNASAHESIWAIPNDRPQKTVREINEAYGFGGGNGGTTMINLSANINVYTQDGQYVGMARVRKKFMFQNLEAH